MLINVLRALINNQFKENFYKKEKKTINILIVFFFFFFSFFIKIVLKLFKNRLLTNALRALVNITLI